jgi:hypothetical protein
VNESRTTPWVETLLSDTARQTRWPATPELRAAVLNRLDGPLPRGRVLVPRRAFAIAVAVLALLVTAVLAHPGTRTAVAEFFGLVEGYRIELVPTVAATSASGPAGAPSATATPTPLDGIASRSTLDAATAALRVAPALVSGEPQPDVYIARFGAQTFVLLRYPRFDLWQGRDGVPGMQVKSLPEGTIIETPSVHGRAAYWVAGVERSVRFVDAEGRDIPGSTRMVTRNALVWSGANRLYRLETDLPLAEALRLANSLP